MSFFRLAVLLVPLCTGCLSSEMLREYDDEPEEPRWSDRFIDPVSAPLTFESPAAQTNVRPIFIHHKTPRSSILKDGHLTGVAVQLRAALTDRFALIAVKDGRFKLGPGRGSPIDSATGYADVAGGFKYVLYDNPEENTLITGGLIYEGTNGDKDILQGNGDGMWRPFVSGAWGDEDVNVVAAVGANLPEDGDKESSSVDYHLHLSPAGDDPFVPLAEINGIHYINNGRTLNADFEGVDYANLGSNDVKGNDIITGALGFRYLFTERGHFGFAYEYPLTTRKDIFGSRITMDWVQRF